MISVLIALFIASQHPTHKNCSVLRDEMVKVLSDEFGCHKGEHTLCPGSFRKELDKVREFSNKICKDGVKR